MQNLTGENLNIAKKGKPLERNWISSNSNIKQCPKDYVKAKMDKT